MYKGLGLKIFGLRLESEVVETEAGTNPRLKILLSFENAVVLKSSSSLLQLKGVLPGSFTHRSNRQITIKVELVMKLKLANPLWVHVKALLCRTTTTRRRNLFTATAINSLGEKKDEVLVVVGGGAAGVYGAIRAKTLSPELRVLVIEKGRFLSKVLASSSFY